MKIISWNVNGIRSCLSKGFEDFVSKNNPDIICVQETKASPDQLNLEIPGYKQFWNSAEKKGYSGTLVLTKIEFLNVQYGINIKKHDLEGRVITAELNNFFLVNVYVPNSGSDRKNPLKRLDYRTKEWDVDFLSFLNNLALKKPVIICGDLNVAYKEIDLANPSSNRGNSGFTDEERESFSNFFNSGFVDIFRHRNLNEKFYTWWSYMGRAYENNTGWRIDYFLCSKSIISLVNNSKVLITPPDDLGSRKSDHAPIMIDIEI